VSVGTALSEARVRAGLTLDDIADRTRIRRTLIENIEADDFHACGGDFYARAHIKSIAQALHIDAAPLLAEFDGEHQNPDLPMATGVLDQSATDGAERRAGGRRPNWTAAMAAALVAVVAFGGFQLVTAGGDDNGTGVTAGQTQDPSEPAAEQTQDTPDQQGGDAGDDGQGSSTGPTDAIAQAPESGVDVVLRADGGRSWVSATGKNGDVLYQSVLDEGSEESVSDDRQVKLVIGNAGAVSLVVNGQDLGAPGAEGEVVRLTFGPGDPTLGSG
jgi:cytoskeleton protein RodZ